jgi:hypothetical protein
MNSFLFNVGLILLCSIRYDINAFLKCYVVSCNLSLQGNGYFITYLQHYLYLKLF